MSYILDALRRADAERERGAVPNIHAQPYAGPSGETDVPRTTTPPWAWVAIGLLVALLAAFAWKLLAGDAAPQTPPVAAAPVTAAPAPSPAPATTPTPPPAVPSIERPVTLPAASLDLPTQAKPPPRAAAAASPDRKAGTPRAEARTASTAPNPASAAGATANPSAAAASTPAERIYKVSELPEEVRRGLPSLPIGGAMHSPTPANRMLIVNGQVFHEGDVIAPELTLEQIRLKSAVLRFRNYRYEISY